MVEANATLEKEKKAIWRWIWVRWTFGLVVLYENIFEKKSCYLECWDIWQILMLTNIRPYWKTLELKGKAFKLSSNLNDFFFTLLHAMHKRFQTLICMICKNNNVQLEKCFCYSKTLDESNFVYLNCHPKKKMELFGHDISFQKPKTPMLTCFGLLMI